MWRAATALAEYADVALDVELNVRKSIPPAGGMAGGSADAAAALVARRAVANRTGSRGVGCPRGTTRRGCHVRASWRYGHWDGRGERLTPALISGQYHWVFAVSDEGLSTPAVYAECDRLRDGRPVAIPEIADDLMAALRRGDAAAVGKALRNDLQSAAISAPAVGIGAGNGMAFGALGGIVSGSGPTCAFLARDEEQALDIASALSGSGTCTSVLHASGPAHGARVIDSGTSGRFSVRARPYLTRDSGAPVDRSCALLDEGSICASEGSRPEESATCRQRTGVGGRNDRSLAEQVGRCSGIASPQNRHQWLIALSKRSNRLSGDGFPALYLR